jgi:flavin reductase (DIM6/NTAB) family NADH-FMN oxidoreductase RutF
LFAEVDVEATLHRSSPKYRTDRGSSAAVSEARLDPATFRTACSRFSTGVAILTLFGIDGLPYGLTVNSFTSVSLDPPLILVCVDNRSHVLKQFAPNCRFGVNVLSEHQRGLSQMFARRADDRFSCTEWTPGKFGAPIFTETLATFECELSQSVPAGDHEILIGRVDDVSHGEGNGLVYFGSAYRNLAPHPQMDPATATGKN